MVVYSIYDVDREKNVDLNIDDIVNGLYEGKYSIKNNENELRKKISKYTKKIPLYDIYTKKIFLIHHDNIYRRVVYQHYRFPDKEIWSEMHINNINFLKNYDLDILKKTYYYAFYFSQPKLVTICQRPSFNPSLPHIKPYYNKQELISMALNLGLITLKDVQKEIEPDISKICAIVGKNDISANTLEKHEKYIHSKNAAGLIKFYSLFGYFYMNKILRDIDKNVSNFYKNSVMENSIINAWELILNSPVMDNDYTIFRYISNDDYLARLKKGSVFIESGFVSCTRNLFYYESIEKHSFGFILLKINIKKGANLLFIESYSNFPYEQEIILPPGSKLRLDNINDDFEIYHYDVEFKKKIIRRYEFTLIGNENNMSKFNKRTKALDKPKENVIDMYDDSLLDMFHDELEHTERKLIMAEFLSNENFQFSTKIGVNEYVFNVESYDSSGMYEPFFYYKVSNGISIYLLNKISGGISLIIEINTELHVNYYFKHAVSDSSTNIIMDEELIKWVSMLAYHLRIERIVIHPNYNLTVKTNDKFSFNDKSTTLYRRITYQENMYQYLKKKVIYFKDIPESVPNFKYSQLDYLQKISPDKILNEKDKDELYQLFITFKDEIKTVASLFIFLVDYNSFYLDLFYKKLNRAFSSDYDNPFTQPSYRIYGYDYLYNRQIINFMPSKDENFYSDKKFSAPRVHERRGIIV